jgi:hypothetical protein
MTRTRLAALLFVISSIAAPAFAQTTSTAPSNARVGVTTSVAGFWDDETFLGRGPMGAVTVGKPLGSHFLAEGELALASHHRDSGYLEAEGKPVLGTARIAFLFPGASSPARGFVSAGYTVIHSTGTMTFNNYPAPPFGPSVPREPPRDWSLTKGGWEIGVGGEFNAGRSWIIRPEYRVFMTAVDSGYTPSSNSLEPPILSMRCGISVQRRW